MMSILCGGNQSILKDSYWLLRHLLSFNKDKCPRCGNKPFKHGFKDVERAYCTECNLWRD